MNRPAARPERPVRSRVAVRRPAKARDPIRIPRGLPSAAKLLFWRQPRLGSGPARRVRLSLGRHRRALAACLALLALWLTIRSAVPAPPATVAVLVAAQDLAAGHQLTPADLRSRAWPATAVPAGLLRAAAGRMLAAPIRAGELLTDARVVGPGLLAGQPSGTVAMVVRLGDPMAGALVGAGDRVDVLVSAQTSWDAAPDLADGTGAAPVAASSGAASPQAGDGGSPAAKPPAGENRAGTNQANPASTGGGASGGNGEDASQDGGAEAERVVAGALVLAAPGSGVSMPGEAGGSGGSGRSGADEGGGLGGLGAGDLNGGLGGGSGGESGAAGDGADQVIVLAVSPAQARRLAMAQTGKFVTIALLQRGSR